MNILSIDNLKKSYGVKTLFENISFTIEDDDKTGVIGINGTGKSSMLRIIAGLDTPDAGDVTVFGSKRVEYLAQTPDLDPGITVLDQVFQANTPETNLVRDYEQATAALSQNSEDTALQKRVLALGDQLDAQGLWNLESQIQTILTQLGISDFDKRIAELSGGQRKRVAMASVLLAPCDLLILDEPTNHLDNETIAWLETFLQNRKGALLMVTHDRYFLDRVVTKTLELDKGHLYDYPGNYSEFVEKKAERYAFESAMEQKRQNLYRRELAWMRRGARARTTKQKARIQRFEILEQSGLNLSEESLALDVAFTRLGRQVVELHHLNKSFAGAPVVSDFSAILGSDERIGIVGRNGRGKSTLLNLIAGRLTPDSGTVTLGETVKLGYFSQESEDMDINLRAIEYIREGAEMVETASGETITAAQMMERFLFDRYAQWVRISEMSGGERRRLYLLRILMAAPNVLLLDEPTNDLDIDTLKVLENYLDGFKGSVLTVSHDRYFLDRVCDTIYGFEAQGRIIVQTGNYTDYAAKHTESQKYEAPTAPKTSKPKAAPTDKPRRLTYKEQQEYATMDTDMAAMESEIDAIDAELAVPTQDYTHLQELTEKKEALEEALLDKMEKKELYDEIVAGRKKQ
ncbi:ABC-F family ATP-binding cassette domain-containing protein [Eubacterium aggregans]|uniref:ATP-binding cassette, subfamily F, uup n=1 Tax=Eubacterium aggregans TaxID=81409 RepID=A0A1H4AS10_9FIRM|nr:ABC-F family ATP-binding cassette domain-containing protein [Eubacterium aggregans]MDD4691904.1 ABC-F family ATP-binding cassette domain-containing protein [Eubacterium aggregans]SEA38557.1 ATP-binding cassette, subfamily F, uup [Eubacterium aggregans]